MNDDPQHREDPVEVGYPPAAEQPIDVDAYEAAGVARIEERDEECDGDCDCSTTGACSDPDDWCSHCHVCCGCLPCEYGRVA